VAKRAWYQYFDELGFAPMPRARILQQINGYPYLNLTISAQRDAEVAALEPMTLLLDGERFPLVRHEKPGFLAGIKYGRHRKKIATTLARYRDELPEITQKAEAWSDKTKELRWTQADVLQVMEEIERVSAASFKIFFAARHNLERIYNRLLWLTQARQPYPANVALLTNTLCDTTAVHESLMAEQLLALGAVAANDPVTVAWLQQGDFADWTVNLPAAMVTAVQGFLATYGHRAVSEAEIAQVRWQDDPTLIFASLKAYVQGDAHRAAPESVVAPRERLLASVEATDQKEVQQLCDQWSQLVNLQSQSLHAFAHALAGTRRWALAAAGEAMADGRLQAQEDVFFFELEEVKQMMTGEWNISARREIQATCEKRKEAYTAWQTTAAPWLLIGDSAAIANGPQGLPAAGEQGVGLLQHSPMPDPANFKDAVVGTALLNSGWSLALPFVQALVAVGGTPLDPIVAAASRWQVPTVVGFGEAVANLVEGAQTTVHGDRGTVEQ